MTDPDTIREALKRPLVQPSANSAVNAAAIDALDRLVDDIDSLRLELEAERHTHRKDNEHLLARIRTLEAALRGLQFKHGCWCADPEAAESHELACKAARAALAAAEPGEAK